MIWSLRHFALISVALTCVVAGCVSGRARQIYVLNDTVDIPRANQAAEARSELQLERVLVPDYLDTTDILSRVGKHELQESSSGRWGERLSLGIMHALWADLAVRLPQESVMPAGPAEKSARQIRVNVEAFDVWPDGHCVLAANWTILDSDRTAVLAAGRGTFIVPSDRSGKPSDDAIVSGMAEALRQLAESIAPAAKALPPRAESRDATTLGTGRLAKRASGGAAYLVPSAEEGRPSIGCCALSASSSGASIRRLTVSSMPRSA